MAFDRRKALTKRHARVRTKISGTTERPRLCIHKSLKHIYAQELEHLGHWSSEAETLKRFRGAMLRMQQLSEAERARLSEALQKSRMLATALAMRQELLALWERSSASKEQLVRQLQDWCRRAESSGIPPLVDFSWRLRSYA